MPGPVQRLQHCRDTLLPQLAALPGISVATPHGGMYAFFRIEGHDDSLALAKRLVTEAGPGLAPGAAFGIEAEGWLRWCFASHDPARRGAADLWGRAPETVPRSIIRKFGSKQPVKARHWSVSPVCASEAPP